MQQRNVKQFLQCGRIVITDIGIGSHRLEHIVPLFPNPDGMCLDSRKIFEVFNAKKAFNVVHFFIKYVKQTYGKM
jgi:hypothetical protein